jgi:CBS domain-containing protein
MVRNVATVKGNTSAESAIRNLYHKHIGSVIVVDEEGACEGIFTVRDALRMIAQKTSLNKPIYDVMTKNPITIREDASFGEAISIISSHGIRHLPVVDENECLVGLLSIRKFFEEVAGIMR